MNGVEKSSRLILHHLQSRPDHGAFTHQVAESAATHGFVADQTVEMAKYHRTLVDGLSRSPQPIDQDSVRAIDRRFNDQIRGPMESELNPNLHHPIIAARRSFVEWFRMATEHDITMFSLWHKDRYDTFQNRLDQASDGMHEQTVRRAGILVGSDMFPKSALYRFMNVRNTHGAYKAMDFFGAGIRESLAECTVNLIWMSNMFDDPHQFTGVGQEMDDASFHEEMHAAAMKGQCGFVHGIHTNLAIGSLIEEPIVCHATAMTSGKHRQPVMPKTMSPGERQDSSHRNYPVEREFAAATHRNIDPSLATNCYWSRRDKPDGWAERREYESRLDRATHPIGTFATVARHYASIAHHKEKERYLAEVMARLKTGEGSGDAQHPRPPLAGVARASLALTTIRRKVSGHNDT